MVVLLTVQVYLNGKLLKISNFLAYVKLYLPGKGAADFAHMTVTDAKGLKRWEVAATVSEGEQKQVSFVNSICTTRGGTHVEHVVTKITKHLMPIIEKKNKGAALKPSFIKSNIWIFVSALINNPSFDSQTKETLKSKVTEFGTRCDLSEDFFKKGVLHVFTI